MRLTGLKSELLGFFRKDFIVGLDIGSSTIKMVQLAKREESLALIKMEIKEIRLSQEPTAQAEEKLKTLKEILHKVDIKRSKFIVTINCPKTAVRVVTVPPMPKGELRQAVQFEARNYFPVPIDESSLDFEVFGETHEKGMKKYRVVVAVSPRKTIDATLSLLKKVGLTPFSIIPLPCALHKLAAFSRPREDVIHCFVDMGGDQTELVILKGRDLIFSRKVPIAGRDFTAAMTGALVSDRGRIALTFEEAEKIKQEVGIPARDEMRLIENKISASQIVSMLHSPLEQLVSEIDRCFDYYREETGGGKVDSLVLYGRGANLKGLSESLSKELGMEVKVGNPLEGIGMEAQVVRPDEGFAPFAGALGAALSLGGGVNLLPPEIKEETQRAFKRATLQSIASAVILVLAFIYVGMRIQFTNYQKRIAVAKLERASLAAELEKVAAQSVVHRVLSEEPYWEDVFKELSNLLPASAFLTLLEMKKGKLTIKGVIASAENEEVLSRFIRNLEEGLFKNVKLVTSREKADKTGVEFELECGFD